MKRRIKIITLLVGLLLMSISSTTFAQKIYHESKKETKKLVRNYQKTGFQPGLEFYISGKFGLIINAYGGTTAQINVRLSNGQLVYSRQIGTPNMVKIDINRLPEGIYYIEAIFDQGYVLEKSIKIAK